MARSSGLVVASAVSLLASVPAIGGTSFQVLFQGIANGVSGDGSVVVGANNSGAFAWTFDGGVTELGNLGAIACSHDGSVIGGQLFSDGLEQAARWIGGRWTTLGGINPTGCDSSLSSTYGMSADGSVIVGLGWQGCSGRAFRWTQADGMIALPQSGSNSARANSISGDGTLIGGWDEGSGGGRRAVIWDAALDQTFVLAGEPGNAGGEGEVWGMNSDGSIFVGAANSANSATRGPFIHRAGEGLAYLGDIPGTAPVVSGAQDVSEDGRIVVGFQREGFGGFAVFDATIWTEETGTVRVSDYLTSLGVEIPAGFQLAATLGVSDDGTVLVGWGYSGFIFNQQAWVATIPGAAACSGDLDGDGVVGGADLGLLLNAWGDCIDCGADLNGDGVVDGADLGLLLNAWGNCR